MCGVAVETESRAAVEAEPIDASWGGPGLLRAIAGEIGLLDLSGLDPGALHEIVAASRLVQRSVAGLLVRAAQRADELAAGGMGPGVEGTLTGAGEVAASAVRAEAARAGAASDLPSFAEALSSGSSRHLSRALLRIKERVGTSREPAQSELWLWQGRNGVGRLAGSFSPED